VNTRLLQALPVIPRRRWGDWVNVMAERKIFGVIKGSGSKRVESWTRILTYVSKILVALQRKRREPKDQRYCAHCLSLAWGCITPNYARSTSRPGFTSARVVFLIAARTYCRSRQEIKKINDRAYLDSSAETLERNKRFDRGARLFWHWRSGQGIVKAGGNRGQ